MAQYLVPGYGYVDSSGSGQSIVPGQFLFDDVIVGMPRRALVLSVTYGIVEITDGQIGTGLKPLVLDGGEIKQRASSEGTPIVLVSGELRTLASTETLTI